MQSAPSIVVPATLRVALIGSGQGVADWLPALTGPEAATAGLVLAALCDLGPASTAAPLHSFAVPDMLCAGDLTALVSASPDIIIDATSPLARLAITRAAMRAGAHVLCHPPLAMDAETALALVGAAARAPGLFAMGYQWRHRAGLRQLRNVVASGAMGNPLAMQVDLGEGDALVSQSLLRGPAGEACDAARFILGCDALAVRGGGIAKGLCFDMGTGVTFQLSAGTGAESWSLKLEGGTFVCQGSGPARAESGGHVLPDPALTPEGLFGALSNLVKAIRDKGKPAVGPRSAAASHAMGLAAQRCLGHGGREETVMPLGLMGDASLSPAARPRRVALKGSAE